MVGNMEVEIITKLAFNSPMATTTYGAIDTTQPIRTRRLACGVATLIAIAISSLTFCYWYFDFPRQLIIQAPVDDGPESSIVAELHVRPQQVHLAYAGTKTGTGMTISWTTYHRIRDSAVWFNSETFNSTEQLTPQMASIHSYYSDDSYTLFTYHVTLTNLEPKTVYYYQVGSLANVTRRSSVFHFRTARPSSDNHSFEMLMYADFGERNAESTVTFVSSLKDRLDLIWHVGDISYADNAFHTLDQDANALGFVYEKAYNAWMNALQSTMQEIPYMTTVGNHEAECYSPACMYSEVKQLQLSNYSAYNTRFRMPSEESNGSHNMWYSWNHGPIHFISVSSETDFPGAPTNNKGTKVENGHFGDQLAWLEADLVKANASRHNHPWIIVGSHRPIYGLKVFKASGHPKNKQKAILNAFEHLFLKFKVDMVVSGHQHAYERHLPIANGIPIMDGVSEDKRVYNNPQAPVYLVSGSCGSTDGHEPYENIPNQLWNVLYDNTHYGVSLLKANRSTLYWSFVDSATGQSLDQFELHKPN
ncbi:calcineurin-like phosphoesterase [Thraustotheca clavata]|uniref:Purple acid phosphatase n=1 Tax=Thraustotheca clavata TaxID=74557 RepID=A0A1V9ZBS3_9STRA|nr:calcineurin-like phosphoesterase [Thraustotheca clavata]